jgi:lysozyme
VRTLFLLLLYGLACLSCRDEFTERRMDFVVHGVDVSHYQSVIDWSKLPGQDIHFAFIKATEGQSLVDSMYRHNWAKAREAGIHRGAYHFFRPRAPVLNQVLNFVREVTLEAGDLPPVLDVETLDGVSPDSLVTLVRAWLHLVEAHYQVRPVLYSNQGFYNRYLSGHFDDHRLWIARYSRDLPKINSARTWHFWQYGDRAQIDGIPALVDLNVYAGDRDSFASLLIQTRPEPLTQPSRSKP